MRTEVMRALRDEFGSDFSGGLFRDEYTVARHPDLVLEDNAIARKRTYLRLVSEYPICVSVNGQYAVVWSVGEYVAFSRAIVVDGLQDKVPGDFSEGHNYLGFASVRECVSACHRLMEEPALVNHMMWHNFRYYQAWLRPEMVALRVLSKLTSGGCID